MFRKFTNREKEELVDLTLIEVTLGNDKKKMIFGFFFLTGFSPLFKFLFIFYKAVDDYVSVIQSSNTHPSTSVYFSYWTLKIEMSRYRELV